MEGEENAELTHAHDQESNRSETEDEGNVNDTSSEPLIGDDNDVRNSCLDQKCWET